MTVCMRRRNPGTRKRYPINGRLVGSCRDNRAEMPGVMPQGLAISEAEHCICSCHTILACQPGCMCICSAVSQPRCPQQNSRCQGQGSAIAQMGCEGRSSWNLTLVAVAAGLSLRLIDDMDQQTWAELGQMADCQVGFFAIHMVLSILHSDDGIVILCHCSRIALQIASGL